MVCTHTSFYSYVVANSKEEQERFLTSVISALSKKDDLKDSLAMAHAHAMRADVLPAEQAVADGQRATQLDPSNDKAWRTLVDAYEATGNTKGAIEALQNWSRASPTFATKALKEIQQLNEKL
jgi:DNA-binding SARP family transcriptional activator